MEISEFFFFLPSVPVIRVPDSGELLWSSELHPTTEHSAERLCKEMYTQGHTHPLNNYQPQTFEKALPLA